MEGKLWNAVCDRYILDELIYAVVMGRSVKYSMKEIQNIMMTTLMCRPIIVLFIHKPDQADYQKAQYLPYDCWDECLRVYHGVLYKHRLPFLEYDYQKPQLDPSTFVYLSSLQLKNASWWFELLQSGNYPIGSHHPKVLIVAERLGPNNMHNIPFETGPTGYMLTDVLIKADIPWYDVAVTNLVKDERRATRMPNKQDYELLELELAHLKPKKVILMGSVANAASSLVRAHDIEVLNIYHLGYLRRSGITDLGPYSQLIKHFVEGG